MRMQELGRRCAADDVYLDILIDEIEAMRVQVAPRWGQIAHDALDDALPLVWRKIEQGRYDPSRGAFRPWCRKVLRNLLFGRGRRVRRRRRWETALPSPGDGEPDGRIWPFASRRDFESEMRSRELANFTGTRFSLADLRRVTAWEEADRILLLGLSGLWRKAPPACWRRWWAAVTGPQHCDADSARDLLRRGATPQERLPILAAALRITNNALSARWMRKKHLLGELDCIQDLGITAAQLRERQPRRRNGAATERWPRGGPRVGLCGGEMP